MAIRAPDGANKNILFKKAHIWLDQILPRCVWSKPYVFKVVLKRHITKKNKKTKTVIVNDKSWQLNCQYWSAFDQAGQRGLVVVVNMTITIIFFIFVNFNIIINYCHPHSHPPLQYWCEWFSLRVDPFSLKVLLWKSVTQEFYKGILLRAAMASRGIFRNTPVICFGLSSIPSMTLKRRKVLILQVIQQMTDRTHQMGNNPLIPVLLFDLTVQIYKQFKIQILKRMAQDKNDIKFWNCNCVITKLLLLSQPWYDPTFQPQCLNWAWQRCLLLKN